MKKLVSVLLILLVAGFVFAGGETESAAPAATPAVAAVSVDDTVASYFSEMPDHIYKIGQADFVAKVAAGEAMTIIDIRSAADYAKGHIVGAVNLAWGTPALYEQLANIPQTGEVYIHCYSGQTAGQAVMLMNFAGIPARSVNLGWNFGISKVEGYDAYVETAAHTLPALGNAIPAAIADAYKGYYEATAAAAGSPFASNIVSEANAKAILDAGDSDVLFVSIRKPADYAAGHIDGAINIPFGSGMYADFASLPADKKLIVYCYTGQTAGQAVAALRVLGYDAASLKGGMGMASNAPLGWANAGFPVVQ